MATAAALAVVETVQTPGKGGGDAPVVTVTGSPMGSDADNSLAAAAAEAESTGLTAFEGDPFALVAEEVATVTERLRQSVAVTIPKLATAASHFFQRGVTGKQVRSTLMLLMGSALHEAAPELEVDTRPSAERPQEMRRRVQRVAEIAELIHTASLLHDDVLDDATSRRGMPSVNAVVGPKVAILGGDFLLARCSVTVASLESSRVMELSAYTLEDLVAGEVMQITEKPDDLMSLDHYERKSYCKTACLMANMAEAVATLVGCDAATCKHVWEYGRHLGLAFQIVDDILDITSEASVLGKPACSDMRNGIPTAPVLFAAEEQPGLEPLIKRRFKGWWDVRRAEKMLHASSGLDKARALARDHCDKAVAAVLAFPPTTNAASLQARAALIKLTDKVLDRKK